MSSSRVLGLCIQPARRRWPEALNHCPQRGQSWPPWPRKRAMASPQTQVQVLAGQARPWGDLPGSKRCRGCGAGRSDAVGTDDEDPAGHQGSLFRRERYVSSVLRMTTPFGNPVTTYSSSQEFYEAYPDLADDWNPDQHPSDFALGGDLVRHDSGDRRWLLVFCTPKRDAHRYDPTTIGTVVAVDTKTGEHHVLDPTLSFAQAEARYPQSHYRP